MGISPHIATLRIGASFVHLRCVASDQTGPYMHDGSLATLEEVVEYYNKGGIRHKYTDVGVRKLRLTDQQKKDLVAFLREGLREIKSGQ